jgi:hypothetical protein
MEGSIMKLFLSAALLLLSLRLGSAQSVVIEATGTASMGDTKSRKETMDEAKTNAKRNAIENASTYIRSETTVKNFMTEKDLVEAFSQAVVTVLEEVKGEWFQDSLMGESFKIVLKVEVTPKEMEKIPEKTEMIDSPTAPLTVKLWIDRDKASFKAGEKINLFIKGNKPFFARIVYVQNDGSLVQILPNPLNKDNYFNGGAIYSLPSDKDSYELVVEPPFGEEKIIVYAGTAPLGDVNLADAGSVYAVDDNLNDTGSKSRGIKIKKKEGQSKAAAEFFETNLIIKTTE